VPIVLVTLPVAWLYLINFGGPRRLADLARQLPSVHLAGQKGEPPAAWTFAEKVVLGVFVCTALLWTFRADIDLGVVVIPGWSRLLGDPTYVTDATVAITMGLVLFAIPADRRGKQMVLDWNCARDIPWGILLLFGGGFALAEGMADSGLSDWIGQKLDLLHAVPTPLLVAGSCVVVVLLTEVTSNTAVAAMMLPVAAAFAHQSDIRPLLIMVPMTISASFAFVLPVATPPNAIVMGSGWVTIPQMAKAGIALDAIGVAIIVTVTFTLGRLVLVP